MFCKAGVVSGSDFLLFVLLAGLAVTGAGMIRDGQARAQVRGLDRLKLALSDGGFPRGTTTRLGAGVVAAYFVALAFIDGGRGAWPALLVDAATACLFVALLGVADRSAAGLAALIATGIGVAAVALLASSGTPWQLALAGVETLVLAVFAAVSLYLAPSDRRQRLIDHLERRSRRGLD
jgi:hypothetical protein